MEWGKRMEKKNARKSLFSLVCFDREPGTARPKNEAPEKEAGILKFDPFSRHGRSCDLKQPIGLLGSSLLTSGRFETGVN